jgi:hypothetical protein
MYGGDVIVATNSGIYKLAVHEGITELEKINISKGLNEFGE